MTTPAEVAQGGAKSPSSTKSKSKSNSPKSGSPTRLLGQFSPGTALPGPDQVIEVDEDETESTYTESETESLRSSILQYKWEHGRRYHAYKDGEYWAPNDDIQQDAEALQHEVYRRILGGKLYLSPIPDDAQSILDLGCGAGNWTMDVADELPSAEVIGIDLSPIQPSFVPPNCRFEVDDMNEEWTFPENKFDLIFLRSTPGCIPDLVEFFKKAKKHLKPGGWFEHVQASGLYRSDDGSLKEDSAIREWHTVFKKLGEITGKTFGTSEAAPGAIREAGYVNLREEHIKLPMGTWPKDPVLKQWGSWYRMFCLQAIEGFSIRSFTGLLGYTYEEAQLYLMQLRKELADPKIHSYAYLNIVCGQKPLKAETA